MAKKGIKGFSALRMFPVTTNTTSAYAVGTKTDIPYAVSASVDRKTEDTSLPADDVIYDSDSEFQSEALEIVVQELPLDLMSALDGADYDEETKEYSWGPDAVAPEIALGFRALRRDGTYRMIQYYSCKVTSIKTEFKTRTENKDGSRYTIAVVATPRLATGKLIRMKDTTTSADLTWLDTVDAIPAT